MSLSRQEQRHQQEVAAATPLVVRNKRGRKVDETLPKSHQREVQRQFRARRTSHLLDLERRVSILERENMILRQYAGFQPSIRYLLGRGPTGCDTTKPLLADENDPEICLVRIEGWTAPNSQSPVIANGHESQWTITPPSATSLHTRPDYALDAHPEHSYATYDGPKSADKLVFEPQLHSFDPHPPKIEHQPHSIPPFESAPPAHFEPVQSSYDAAPPARFDCPPPSAAPETMSKREMFPGQLSTVSPLSSLLSSSTGSTRNTLSHGLYSSDSRTPFTVTGQHDSTGAAAGVPATPYQSGANVIYSWPTASNGGDSYSRSHAPSLSSVNLPTNSSGPGTTDHRHQFQGPSIPSYSYRPTTSLNSFTPAPATQGQHPSFQPVDAQTENTFTG